jgi:hypothetical protein
LACNLEQEDRSQTLSQHLPPEDFELYALGQLPKRRSAAVESHVAECLVCAATLTRVLRQVDAAQVERRSHPRTATAEQGWMQVMEPPRLGAWEVRILDVSREGMSLQTRQHVAPGCKIKVRRGGMIVFGEVRYCIPSEGEFRAGILIREVL